MRADRPSAPRVTAYSLDGMEPAKLANLRERELLDLLDAVRLDDLELLLRPAEDTCDDRLGLLLHGDGDEPHSIKVLRNGVASGSVASGRSPFELQLRQSTCTSASVRSPLPRVAGSLWSRVRS
jgi:hypothetical protein